VSSVIALSRTPLLDVPRVANLAPANAVRRDAARALTPPVEFVYGDSTPFPHATDFIATTRAVVECGVALMSAQHKIEQARGRVHEAQEHLAALHVELEGMSDAVRSALSGRASRRVQAREVADRIDAMARGAVDAESKRAHAVLEATVADAEDKIVEARRSAVAGLGRLLARHDMPGQTVGFRLFASGERYGAEIVVQLPCALRATFDARFPEGHAWGSPRRVRDVLADTTITLPREVGWFSKRVRPVAVRLDGLMILGASLEGMRGALLLGKRERDGVEHAFDLDFTSGTPRVQWRDGDERATADLGAQDAARMARMLRAVERATRDLASRRATMTEATLDGRPAAERDPGEPCARLIDLVGAIVREIGRRSGAPGELVLRRNVDAGHRDEVFVTTAELLEQIETLHPSLRRAFAPLELDGRPRSPRAPIRSLPSYEEIHECEIVGVG
jgi:hypothetical protein